MEVEAGRVAGGRDLDGAEMTTNEQRLLRYLHAQDPDGRLYITVTGEQHARTLMKECWRKWFGEEDA